MKKTVSLTVTLMLLIAGFVIYASKTVEAESGGILYVGGSGPGNYTSIQAAINNANNGDTIFVYSGTYYENILVNKTVTLIGEDRNTTVIDGEGSGNDIIRITAEKTNISGFTIQNNSFADFNASSGIDLESNHTKISEVIIKNTVFGIMCKSNNNFLINNSFINNTFFGVYVYGENNTINNNAFINDGIGLDYNAPVQKSVKHNTINGKPIIYLQNQSNQTISNAGQVVLANCENITVKNLRISNVSIPIQFYRTNNSSLIGNTLLNCVFGVFGEHSNNVLIQHNTIKSFIFGVHLSFVLGEIKIADNLIENSSWDERHPFNYFAYGLHLYHSEADITVVNNTFNNIHSNCTEVDEGIAIWSDYSYEATRRLIQRNNINNTGWGIIIPYANGAIIQSNKITNITECGMKLCQLLNSTISNCDLLNSSTAITLYYSTNNTIFNCNIIGNDYGIKLENSSDNIIYNNYFDNINNAYDNGNNRWNISKTSGVNIIGGSYLGGNYWSDYNGIDFNGDGLGDTQVPHHGDHLPLTTPSIDSEPPVINIEKPSHKHIYVFGREKNFPVNIPWVIGRISVLVYTTDTSGIDKVEFYVDNKLKHIDHVSPYTWTFSEKSFGRVHTIKVVSYDNAENSATEEIKIRVFNLRG